MFVFERRLHPHPILHGGITRPAVGGLLNPPSPDYAVAVGWSPDSAKVAGAFDWGDNLTMWTSSGALLFSANSDNAAGVTSPIRFLPSENAVVFSESVDGGHGLQPQLRDVTTGRAIRYFDRASTGRNEDPIYDFLPYLGNMLIILQTSIREDKSYLTALNAENGNVERRLAVDFRPSSVAMSSSGRYLVLGSYHGDLEYIDINNFAPAKIAKYPRQNGFSGLITGLAISSDAKYAFVTGARDNEMSTAMIDTNPEGATVKILSGILQTSTEYQITQAQWDPKDRYVLFLRNRAIYSYKFKSKKLTNYPSLGDGIYCFGISPDGERLAVCRSFGIDVYRINGDK